VRNRGVIVSAIIHVVVFAVAMQAAKRSSARRIATAVVVAEKKKPKPEEKPKPKPKAKPKAEPVVEPQPLKNAPSKAAPETAPAPVETNLQMSNDNEPGIAVGPPKNAAPKGPATNAPSAQKSGPVKKEKALGPKDDNPETDTCTEAPSKPVPVQRTEIGYTDEARANNVEGRLVLRITVGADGAVLKVEVLQKVDPQLDAAVVAAVRGWVFKPSMRCGRALAGGVFTMAKDCELSD
jgi:TonB family protein